MTALVASCIESAEDVWLIDAPGGTGGMLPISISTDTTPGEAAVVDGLVKAGSGAASPATRGASSVLKTQSRSVTGAERTRV